MALVRNVQQRVRRTLNSLAISLLRDETLETKPPFLEMTT